MQYFCESGRPHDALRFPRQGLVPARGNESTALFCVVCLGQCGRSANAIISHSKSRRRAARPSAQPSHGAPPGRSHAKAHIPTHARVWCCGSCCIWGHFPLARETRHLPKQRQHAARGGWPQRCPGTHAPPTQGSYLLPAESRAPQGASIGNVSLDSSCWPH